MGQFKPMVKMYTDEPSVILKLKKGGKVKHLGKSDGFKAMHHTASNPFAAAEAGRAPKKPSLAERRRAMNPNMYAKGGKVAHKQYGGAMPMAAPAAAPMAAAPMGAAPMAPMSRQAVMGMDPRARAARAAAVRRAIAGMRGGMKKGGKASADCAKLERELKHHESMSAAKAHGKASGGEIDAAETKTTLKNSVKPYAKTKMDTAKRDTAHGTGDVKMGKPAGYAMGGSIMGNEKPYENTKMVTAGKGKTNGSTGGVRMSNAGGYKHGGKAVMKAAGGTIKGGNWENRPANTAKPGVKNTKTGEVKEANAGGYRKGGAAKKAYATGGNVVDDGKAVAMPRRHASLPVANSLQSGTFKRGGNVKKADGGDVEDKYAPWSKEKSEAYKKSLPMASRTDPEAEAIKSAHAKKMGSYLKELDRQESSFNPRYSEAAVNKAIASSNRSGRKISGREAKAIHRLLKGRYAEGGNVKRYNRGDAVMSEEEDAALTAKNQRAYDDYMKRREAENIADRNMIPDFLSDVAGKVKEFFTPKGEQYDYDLMGKKRAPGSVTRTEKSVTVSPPKKRGGLAKC